MTDCNTTNTHDADSIYHRTIAKLEDQIEAERRIADGRVEACDEVIANREVTISQLENELVALQTKLGETTIALGLKNDDVAQLESKVEDQRKEYADYHNLSIGQMLDAKLKDLIGEATHEAVDNIEVDADDVQGLTYLIESECEDQLNGREVEADDVQGLSNYVDNAIDEAFNEATVRTTIER